MSGRGPAGLAGMPGPPVQAPAPAPMSTPAPSTASATPPTSAHEPATGNHRSKPRRRGDELLAAIFDAALAELEESGYAQASMDGIARRARVSKASIYRRWPGKAELVFDAVKAGVPDAGEARDTGSLRGDILAHYLQLADALSGPAGGALRGVLGESLRDPAMAERFGARARGRNLDVMRSLAGRAVRRGELAAVPASSLRLEAGYNLIRHEFLTGSGPGEQFLAGLVDEVVLPLLHAPQPDPRWDP